MPCVKCSGFRGEGWKYCSVAGGVRGEDGTRGKAREEGLFGINSETLCYLPPRLFSVVLKGVSPVPVVEMLPLCLQNCEKHPEKLV